MLLLISEIISLIQLNMILKKTSFQKFFRGLLFVTTPHNYFSSYLNQISKEGIKAIISKNIQNYVLDQFKDKPNNVSFRDLILKSITTKNIHQLIQNKTNNNQFGTSLNSSELIQGVQDMRKYFIEGVDIDTEDIFQQGRFEDGAKDSENESKKIAFFPTSFTYPKIFSIPKLTKRKARLLTLGTAGTGKSLAIVFLTMISNNINKYLCSGSHQEIEYLRQFGLALIPKIFYITFNSATEEDSIINSLKKQSLQFSKQIHQITGLKQICKKLKNLYKEKTGQTPILVIDQINYLMSQYRRQKKKININQFIDILDGIHLLSLKRVYNSSVNIQKDILLKQDFGIVDHTGTPLQINTSFLPFDQVVKKQLGLYFFFELWQRNILKARNTESKIIDEILVDILQENQTVDQLLQFFVKDLGFLPKRVTPLVINSFVKDWQKKGKIASNMKEIQQIIDQFKIYVKKGTDKKIAEFFHKGSDEAIFSKMDLMETFLSEAQIIQETKNEIQKKKEQLSEYEQSKSEKEILEKKEQISKDDQSKSEKEIQEKKDQINKLTQQMQKIEKIFDQFRLITSDESNFQAQSFDRQLFEVKNSMSQDEQTKQFEIRPTVRFDEFLRVIQPIYTKHFLVNWMNYAKKNTKQFPNKMWNWIQSKDEKGKLFENMIFKLLGNKNTQVSIFPNQQKFKKDLKLNGKFKNKTVYFKQFYPSLDKKQNSFQECFSKIFDLYNLGNLKKNFFCLPKNRKSLYSENRKQLYSQNNPSVDFVIAEFKQQGIIFHMFDATITMPSYKNYGKKADKAFQLFHTFAQFKKQSGIEEDKNGFIKRTYKNNQKEVKYKINHNIFGLFETKIFYQKDYLKLSLQGVESISCLSIKDFKVKNEKSHMQNDFKTFEEVTALLNYKSRDEYLKMDNQQKKKFQELRRR